MSASASVGTPLPPERGTLIQRNPRLKVCAYCKTPGAQLKCEACEQRNYCNTNCQKKDWKKEHKKQCKTLQQAVVPSKPGQREAAVAAARDGSGGGGGAVAAAGAGGGADDAFETPCASGGSGGGAAAAAGGGSDSAVAAGSDSDRVTAADIDDEENLCPICLDNMDNAVVDGIHFIMCGECGQSYCGACNAEGLTVRSPNCPTCRAPFNVWDKKYFKQVWKLVHDRSPGRHTPLAQNVLGCLYDKGKGVKHDCVEAYKWYRKSAETGNAVAQFNVGAMHYTELYKQLAMLQDFAASYVPWLVNKTHNSSRRKFCTTCEGVGQDHVDHVNHTEEALKWYRKSAEKGYAWSQHNIGRVYCDGLEIEEDFTEAVKWLQLAAEQGFENSIKNLKELQQDNCIPTPPPGTAVITILLTSAKAAKYNNRKGKVVEPSEGVAIKPGRAAVLFDGEVSALAFKVKNLRVLHP